MYRNKTGHSDEETSSERLGMSFRSRPERLKRPPASPPVSAVSSAQPPSTFTSPAKRGSFLSPLYTHVSERVRAETCACMLGPWAVTEFSYSLGSLFQKVLRTFIGLK